MPPRSSTEAHGRGQHWNGGGLSTSRLASPWGLPARSRNRDGSRDHGKRQDRDKGGLIWTSVMKGRKRIKGRLREGRVSVMEIDLSIRTVILKIFLLLCLRRGRRVGREEELQLVVSEPDGQVFIIRGERVRFWRSRSLQIDSPTVGATTTPVLLPPREAVLMEDVPAGKASRVVSMLIFCRTSDVAKTDGALLLVGRRLLLLLRVRRGKD